MLYVMESKLAGFPPQFSCEDHKTGNHQPSNLDLDPASVCWFDSAHGVAVSDEEVDAMVYSIR